MFSIKNKTQKMFYCRCIYHRSTQNFFLTAKNQNPKYLSYLNIIQSESSQLQLQPKKKFDYINKIAGISHSTMVSPEKIPFFFRHHY